MDTDFRKRIAGKFPPILAIDQLAETIEEGGVRGRDCHVGERLLKPERGKLFCSMRQQIDADADRLDLGSGFENAAGNFGLVQREP